jgi:glycosyltransferase involved in cell wall biosynthesis
MNVLINTISRRPLVSILMNCYNGEKYVEKSIESILKQTYDNFEIVFWDNNSTDKTAEIVKKFNDSRIKYYKGTENVVLGEARNLGISKCVGEFIAFLDSDDLWLPKKLELQIPQFDDPKVGIVICNTIFFTDDYHVKLLRYSKPPVCGSIPNILVKNYHISLETVIVRAVLLQQYNIRFEKDYEIIEEFDFILKLSCFTKISFVDETLAMWRMHPNSISNIKENLYPLELRNWICNIVKDDFYISKFTLDSINYLSDKTILKQIQLFVKRNEYLNALRQIKNIKSIKFRLFSYIICIIPASLFSKLMRWFR